MAVTTPIVAIIGRANVGKSSIFNRLVGTRQAIIDDEPGTTRDANYGLVAWGRHNFWLVDTAGIKHADNELESDIRSQIETVADTASVLVVAIDATTMITSEDREAARLALKSKKPVILVLSKIDAAKKGPADAYERLGIKDVAQVSAIHGSGTGDLLDMIVAHVKPVAAPVEDNIIRIALLGRPNVGKSSLLNQLAGKQQALTSDIGGTTRDVNNVTLKYHGITVQFSDTAGLRRRGKIERGVEKFSSLRTLGAITEADVCVLLIDALEPTAAQDQHIAGQVIDAGKGLILAVNKWDALEKDDKTQARTLRRLEREYAFVPWAPVVFTSAVQGQNVTKLFELAREIYDRRQQKITTANFNKTIQSLILKHPPAGLKNRQPKINYGTQTSTNPPSFAVFASHANFIHFSYRRYIENGLRDAYDFTGTPIKLEFRDKHKEK